jgi:hypothetical protein
MPAPRAPSRQRLHAEHPRILCLRLEERQIATDRQFHARRVWDSPKRAGYLETRASEERRSHRTFTAVESQ